MCVCVCVCVLTVSRSQQQCSYEDDEGDPHCVSNEALQTVELLLLLDERVSAKTSKQTNKELLGCINMSDAMVTSTSQSRGAPMYKNI